MKETEKELILIRVTLLIICSLLATNPITQWVFIMVAAVVSTSTFIRRS